MRALVVTRIIGQSTRTGLGSDVINNIRIGKNIVIGAGSCVINNLCYRGVYIRIPAKNIDI